MGSLTTTIASGHFSPIHLGRVGPGLPQGGMAAITGSCLVQTGTQKELRAWMRHVFQSEPVGVLHPSGNWS